MKNWFSWSFNITPQWVNQISADDWSVSNILKISNMSVVAKNAFQIEKMDFNSYSTNLKFQENDKVVSEVSLLMHEENNSSILNCIMLWIFLRIRYFSINFVFAILCIYHWETGSFWYPSKCLLFSLISKK